MKYIVMECRPSYAIVLDEEGRFRMVANLHYQTGQTVTHIVELRETRPRGRKWAYGLVAAAACLLIAFAALFLPWAVQPVYASVYLSVNPQVRIDVDKKERVLLVEGLNDDGALLAADISYQGQKLESTVDALLERAVALGYLSAGGAVAINLDAPDEAWLRETGGQLRQHLTENLGEQVAVTIHAGQPAGGEQQTAVPVTSPRQEPEDNGYGVSDYQQQETPAAPQQPQPDGMPGEDGITDYGMTDYGSSDYDNADNSAAGYGTGESGDSLYDDDKEEDNDNADDSGGMAAGDDDDGNNDDDNGDDNNDDDNSDGGDDDDGDDDDDNGDGDDDDNDDDDDDETPA